MYEGILHIRGTIVVRLQGLDAPEPLWAHSWGSLVFVRGAFPWSDGADCGGAECGVVVPWGGEGGGSFGDDGRVVADEIGEHGTRDLLDEAVEGADAGGLCDADRAEAFAEAV